MVLHRKIKMRMVELQSELDNYQVSLTKFNVGRNVNINNYF